jgi:hypothetical protein
MGFGEATIIALALFFGLNELGSEIKKGLIEAAKETAKGNTVAHSDSEDKA